jgi:hypothetical protein
VDDVTRWIDADWDIGAQHRTFQLKPGVMIGDIGKKMGRDGIDNGYIQVSGTGIVSSKKHRLMS